MYNILICDDEKDIVSAIEIYLKTAGYSVYKAYNGMEAVDMVNSNDIQLVLMDVMMPQMDGITAMAKIRESSNVPVIMLTAKSEDTDKVLGGGETPKDKLVIGGIELDDKSKQVTLDGELMPLTPTEYDILKLLMQNVGKVFSTKEIYKAVWKEDPMGAEGSVAVHIRHLREKIEINPSDPRYIKVIWGRGYRMEGK